MRRVTQLPLDVHLMVTDPDRFLDTFVEAGASILTVHVEVLPHLIAHPGHQAARLPGRRRAEPVDAAFGLEEVAGEVDLVLVMSVNPGFGGQAFLPQSESKIARVRQLLTRAGRDADIEVDGGVDQGNIGARRGRRGDDHRRGGLDFRHERPEHRRPGR